MSRITELSEPGRTSRVKQLMDDPSVEPRDTRRAIVIGGSVAGLLAARVLSDSFGEVMVVDRD
jgi:heterodisulfide reductase subunit A-like polyferredoxin